MDFTAACDFVMPFGKHKGQTIARVGSSDEGLRYLDWLIGQPFVNNGGPLKESMRAYLNHPSISAKLDSILG